MRLDVQIDRTTLGRNAVLNGQLSARLADTRGLNFAAAQGALPVVQRNFVNKGRTNRNRFGAGSTFWNRMLAGTVAGADASHGWVRMPREVALRFHGGTVRPKKAKNLSIPARAEAYNKSPRQFNDLRFVMFGTKAKALMKGENVYFWLVPMATIKADRTVLPPQSELAAGAITGVRIYTRRATA